MAYYYPVHLDLTGKLCVVLGGGPVAERKVGGLLEAGARVRVVTLEATATLRQWHSDSAIDLIFAPYDGSHVEGACLVFAATDRVDINMQIAADARAHNVWVNRADAYEAGDFIVPATVRAGEMCLSVSTGGNQPLLAARLAQELQERFGPEYGDYVGLLGQMRLEIKSEHDRPVDRRGAMQVLLDAEEPLRALLRSGLSAQALVLARQLVSEWFDEEARSSRELKLNQERSAEAETGG